MITVWLTIARCHVVLAELSCDVSHAQHTSNSFDSDMSTDNEIHPEDRFWGYQDIFWRGRDLVIYDGIRAGEQGSSTLMDST